MLGAHGAFAYKMQTVGRMMNRSVIHGYSSQPKSLFSFDWPIDAFDDEQALHQTVRQQVQESIAAPDYCHGPASTSFIRGHL